MKTISFHQRITYGVICICLVVIGFSACQKLAGLPLQENQDHPTTTIDPHVNKTAWQYIKDRAIAGDSIFYLMYQGILYSGIDTMEYTKPGRTFIVYHKDASLRKSGTTTPTDCYFGKYKVG